MGMPGWAIGLGAALKAPEVANDYMGLFKNINAMRDDSNASDALQKIQQFQTSGDAASYQPDGYLSPASRQTLEKLRQEKLDTLLNRESAPFVATAAKLTRDPEFNRDPEALQEFASRPDFWLGANDTGAIAGGKKGGTPVTAAGGNPYTAQTVQQFGQGNQNVLDAFRASNGDRMSAAHISTDKDRAIGFKDAAQGLEMFAKQDVGDKERAAEQEANMIIADHNLTQDIGSWNALADKLRRVPNFGTAKTDAVLKNIADRNNAPVGWLDQTVTNGPNSTVSRVGTDMFGNPVNHTRTESSYKPSDRAQGLTAPGAGGTAAPAQIATVSYPGPNGETMEQQITLGATGDVNNALVAGVVDKAKRGVPGYHVSLPMTDKRGQTSFKEYGTKPGKEKGGAFSQLISGTPPAAAATGGPDIATAQRLVAKYGSAEAARAAYAQGDR